MVEASFQEKLYLTVCKTQILSKCAIESARKNVPFGSDNVQDLLGY